ncbi:MAG: hypothetical protein OJF52_000792 [Nitrospira sp.]|nr:MAG: hypothetical protein OJF52_000792 [Nitrospira sp.]
MLEGELNAIRPNEGCRPVERRIESVVITPAMLRGGHERPMQHSSEANSDGPAAWACDRTG